MGKLIEIKEIWSETKERLKQKFTTLTGSEILLLEGKQDETLGRLQVKLGKTKEEVQNIIAFL